MDNDVTEPAAEVASNIKCSNCGGNLKFSPGIQSLSCEYCNTINVIEKRQSAIVENDFLAFLDEGASHAKRQSISTVKCETCGAATTLPPNVTSANCPYCDAPQVIKNASTCDIIKPGYLLPFRIERNQAREEFVKWAGKIWFAPNRLKEYARHSVERLKGIYMPFWTYDTDTRSAYTGSRGEHYYVTETYRDAQGNTRTHQVRKTRWYPASGTVYNDFDDVLVCASDSLPKDLVNELEPWDLPELVDYSDAYLAGFLTESYRTPLKEGFEQAKQRMRPTIESTVRHDIGGDEQIIISLNTAYSRITFKHILLPLWISAYRYKGKVYRFTVNARTGEVQGERPYSAWKIFFFGLAVLAIIGVAIYLKQ